MLLVSVSAADYTSFTSGSSCEANGADSITSEDECSAAATALGLSVTTVATRGQWDSYPTGPHYCYWTPAWADPLKFNYPGTNTGVCSSSHWSAWAQEIRLLV